MEQNELLLRKLQTSPEYRKFQNTRKTNALGVLLFGIFAFCVVAFDIKWAVTHGLSVRHDVVLMSIVLVCLAVSVYLVFTTFAQTKPVFITEGIIKEVQPKSYRSMKANWYLISDNKNQEYWGTSPLFLFYNSLLFHFHDGSGNKSHAIGEKVLCFSMGGEKWIVSDES